MKPRLFFFGLGARHTKQSCPTSLTVLSPSQGHTQSMPKPGGSLALEHPFPSASPPPPSVACVRLRLRKALW
jgi:hypothetical protein